MIKYKIKQQTIQTNNRNDSSYESFLKNGQKVIGMKTTRIVLTNSSINS